jgi:hypothetical protein
MTLSKLVLPFLLAACLSAPAYAKEDASHFLLTPALMQKFKAAQADAAKYEREDKDDDKDDGDKDQSIEGIMKKIERDPKAKALLAKHGIGTREYAHAAYAMLHAGMFVALEKSMDKAGREKLYAGYTSEQKANISLMRTYVAENQKKK